jgi:PAS domain S-box-containing protein
MAKNFSGDRSVGLSTSEPLTAVVLQLADGTIAACNPAAAKILGYATERLIGQTYWDLPWQAIHPDGSALTFDTGPAGQLRANRVMGFKRPDGKLVRLKLDFQPLFRASESAPYAVITSIELLPNSEVLVEERHGIKSPEPLSDVAENTAIAMAAVSRDLGDCQFTEAALRESEQRLQDLANNVPSIVWTATPDGTITWASDGWYAYTGITPEQNARDWPQVVHPEDLDRCLKAWQQALEGGGEYEIEVRNRRYDGEYRWFLTKAAPKRDRSHNIIAWFGSTTDIDDLKATERRWQESEELLRLAMQVAGFAIAKFDYTSNTVTLSPEAAAIYGLPADELVVPRSRVHATFHPADRDEMARSIEQVLDPAGPGWFVRDCRVVWPSGAVRWLTVRKQVFFDRSVTPAKPTHGIQVALDISDRQQAQTALWENEERLRLALTAANQGLYDLNVQTGETIVSPEYARMLDYEPAGFEENNAKWRERLHPDDRERVSQVYEDYIAGRCDRYQVEFRQRTKLGNWKWILSVGSIVEWDRDGKPLRLLGIHADITARKRTEIALRESEERYRYLVESIPQLVWTANPKGVLIDVNQRWTDYTGVTLAQVHLDGWQSIVHPDDLPAITERWRLASAAGGHYQAEGRMRRADGIYRWHLHQAIPLKDESGQIVKWFGSATDIHDRVELEIQRDRLLQQEQDARAAAERANRLKDEFLAVVSHELRSPLNPILGWVQILQRRRASETRTVEGLAAIDRNAKLLSQLIEDLLDISRVMRGKLALKSVPVSLAPVIAAALETVRLAAEVKGLQIDLALDTNVGRVLGDAGRLQQVVWNLLSNAVKFTPEKGQVEVRLEQVEVAEGNESGASAAKSFSQLSVRDTGKGISAEFLPYVFEYFRQEDSSIARHFGGLGLGMSIARQIVELHSGTIWVESAGEGQGATFFVRIPLLPEAIAPRSEPERVSSFLLDSLPLAGMCVLAVDDDADNRQLLALLLEESGATVTAAASASEALAILERLVPDILLSDIGMPEMDGYALLQAIRSLPSKCANVPAIALTAYAQEVDQQQAIAVGFQAHLAKPIEPELLIAKILAIVDN